MHISIGLPDATRRGPLALPSWRVAVAFAAVGLLAAEITLHGARWPALWWLCGAPVVEEVTFRAGVQTWLRARVHERGADGDRWAIVLTALLFAAAHGAVQMTPSAWLTLWPALALGVLFQRTQRVADCIVVHAFFNGLWLLGGAGLAAAILPSPLHP